ncbi:liguleless2 [Panicum miliaceum]|uniref:Liguleless2 n=1 Tax=Panicum miliaceum TaxID=4540 RepID=A0A3L6SP36_PANMI|nr:liguleless2 [Panicum miliaceum]
MTKHDSPELHARFRSVLCPIKNCENEILDHRVQAYSSQKICKIYRISEQRIGQGDLLLALGRTERRLAQNREAARKSRLRKKAYVQQLETSRIRLQQVEHELQRARSQGLFVGGCSAAGDMSSGAAMFDMEYARWLDDDSKRLAELRGGLQAHLLDGNLGLIVEECMQHYDELFQLKAALARADVFHLLTGSWATPAERCFFWMGGFRPSELLKILIPQLDPLTEQQLLGICNLQQSSEQAEEALAQGLHRLHQSLADTVAAGTLNDGVAAPNYMSLMAVALEKLASLESFYQQADNLRQQTLHQMRRILTTRQAARCFLSIGEYNRRLRALSNLWASRPRENFIGTESLSPTATELQRHQLPRPCNSDQIGWLREVAGHHATGSLPVEVAVAPGDIQLEDENREPER